MILQSAHFRRFCHPRLHLAIDYTAAGGQGRISRKERIARAAAGMPAEHPELVTRKPGRAECKLFAAWLAVAARPVHRDRRRGAAPGPATRDARLEVITMDRRRSARRWRWPAGRAAADRRRGGSPPSSRPHTRLPADLVRPTGAFARVHIGSADTGDIPDDPAARLVIVHPQYQHVRGDVASAAMLFARRALDTRGSAQRVNRNMVAFLAADAKRMEELGEAVRDFLAWKDIAGRVEELNLSVQQATQARTRLAAADEAVGLRIVDAYHWALVPVQPQADRPVTWDVVRADGAHERLAERASDKLCKADLLRTVHGARSIRFDLDNRLPSVWQNGHVRVGELWGYYCRHPYLPRLRDRGVLDDGILGVGVASELTWDAEGFAVAARYDEETGRYLGLTIPGQDPFGQITDQTLLVRPELALAQRDAERPEPPGPTPQPPGPQQRPPRPSTPPPQPELKNTRFFGVARLNPERYARDLTRLSKEIIQHLAAPEGVELEVRVDIVARKADGFPEDKVRIVAENARTLKFESYGFEDR